MHIKSLSSLALIFCTAILPGTSMAQDGVRDLVVEKVFEYGGSCSQLAQLTRVELVGITHKAYAEQFFEFCKPDNVYRCEDYNALLAGVGRLEDNDNNSCRYLPR